MYCIKLPFIALNYRTVHNFTVHLMPRKVLELNPFTNTRRKTHVIQAFNMLHILLIAFVAEDSCFYSYSWSPRASGI